MDAPTSRPDQDKVDAIYRRASEADALDTENERLCERVKELAEKMLALATLNGLTCQCGHNAGCENSVVALVPSAKTTTARLIVGSCAARASIARRWAACCRRRRRSTGASMSKAKRVP